MLASPVAALSQARAIAKPKIGLVTGLSGTGKTDLSNWMVRECGFLHFDGDIRDGNGIDFCNLRSEWNQFWERNDASRLAETLNARSLDAGSNGALLSLPSTAVFTPERLQATKAVGIETVLLFGRPEHCIGAYLERERMIGSSLTEDDWRRNNQHVYDQYSATDFDQVRIKAFNPNGSRVPRGEIVEAVLGRFK